MSRDIGNIAITFPFLFSSENWRTLVNNIQRISNDYDNKDITQYLPIGSEYNNFDWIYQNISKEELFRIIEVKNLKKEQIGFSLSNIHNLIDFLMVYEELSKENKTTISFNFSCDAKIINNTIMTDFSIYLNLLYPTISGLSKEFFINCSQYIDR